MSGEFVPYGGLAQVINTLKTDDEIKVFLTKYKQWYITRHNLSKEEAEKRVVFDLRYFFIKFIKNEELVTRISNIMNNLYNYQL